MQYLLPKHLRDSLDNSRIPFTLVDAHLHTIREWYLKARKPALIREMQE